MSGLVRTQKASKLVRGTHILERAKVGTGQDIGRKNASIGHSLPEAGRGQDWSEHRKKVN